LFKSAFGLWVNVAAAADEGEKDGEEDEGMS
jgi:hypothetical protein